MSLRLHITDSMVEAAFRAMMAEAIKDGFDERNFKEDYADRMREVARAMLQAAADTVMRKSN